MMIIVVVVVIKKNKKGRVSPTKIANILVYIFTKHFYAYCIYESEAIIY